MSDPTSPAPRSECVGLAPWLPWPFSAAPAWTVPVRAERLALLRIGVCLCLLLDIVLQLAPYALDFYGKDQLGQPRLLASNFKTSMLNWSLLRGIGSDALPFLSLIAYLLATCWIFGTDLLRLRFVRPPLPVQDRTGLALAIWTSAWFCLVAGMWSRLGQKQVDEPLAWLVPLAGVGVVLILIALEMLLNWRDPTWRIPWVGLGATALVHAALLAAGLFLAQPDACARGHWWMRLLGPWQQDDELLLLAMGLWIAVTCLLMVGCCSRTMAILTWLLTISFGSLNTYIDSSGDVIRNILLLYLMLCPCGAAWSLDAWWKRWRSGAPRTHVLVHPWPIRLIFTQMIFMYFMNGLHKIAGEHWRDGTSLHYVLGDLTFARLSHTWLGLSTPLTRIMTWSVLAWELSFPLLVAWKWTRPAALIFGVLFHLGILVLMEISVFPLYTLCMYLPLLPIGEKRST